MILRPLARLALAAAILASGAAGASADAWGDYANARLGEALRRSDAERQWRDLVARPYRHAERLASGPRSWDASQENPWANTFGTPPASRWRSTPAPPGFSGVVRLCTCYLPADARSWDGGPLTEADIARRCRAQCY